MTVEQEIRDAGGAGSEEALARFETNPHGVLVVGPDRTIQFADPYTQTLFGYAGDELIGLPLSALLPATADNLGAPSLGEPPLLSYLEGRNRLGAPIELQVAVARGGSPDGDLLVAVREVSPSSRRDEHRRRADIQDVLARFASRTCHDLKNHLMALTGYTELAMGRLERDPERARQMLQQVMEASERVLAYVERTHALGRGRPEGIEAHDVGTLLDDLAPRLAEAAPEGVRLRFEKGLGEGWAELERERFFQGLVVLVENAAAASEPGSEVVVRTGQALVSNAESLPDLPPGPYVTVEIADRGTGMDDETRAKLFEPFIVEGRDRDRGLGLATLYAFCRKLGGSVLVESEPGQGTAVRIFLPRCDRPEAIWLDGEGEAASAGDTAAAGRTVLVVDDVAGVREIAREALVEAGYRVRVAGGGDEAMRMVAQRDGKGIDLLLTDVLMPGMSGPELVKALKERWPDIPVLFMSAYSREPLPARIAGRPAPFLAKPFTPKELAAKVGAVLAEAS